MVEDAGAFVRTTDAPTTTRKVGNHDDQVRIMRPCHTYGERAEAAIARPATRT